MDFVKIIDEIGNVIARHASFCPAKHHAIFFELKSKTINLFCSDSLDIIKGEKIATLESQELKGLKQDQYKTIARKILEKLK